MIRRHTALPPHCCRQQVATRHAKRAKPRERNGPAAAQGEGGGINVLSLSPSLSPTCPLVPFGGGALRAALRLPCLAKGLRLLPSGSSASALEQGLLFWFPFRAPGKVRSSSASVLGPL